MRSCPDCGCRIDAPVTTGPTKCPHCHGDVLVQQAQTWTPVARLTDLAEAGFAENLLAEEGIPSCVRQHEDFSAVDGSWTPVYVLQVPAELAQPAAEKVRQELVASAGSITPAGDDRPPSAATVTAVWGPLALMVIAGGLAYLAANGGLPEQRQPAGRDTRQTLWDAVREIDGPFESRSVLGGPRHRLRFDPDREIVTLDEDRDGDGTFERQREFQRDHNKRWKERDPR